MAQTDEVIDYIAVTAPAGLNPRAVAAAAAIRRARQEHETIPTTAYFVLDVLTRLPPDLRRIIAVNQSGKPYKVRLIPYEAVKDLANNHPTSHTTIISSGDGQPPLIHTENQMGGQLNDPASPEGHRLLNMMNALGGLALSPEATNLRLAQHPY